MRLRSLFLGLILLFAFSSEPQGAWHYERSVNDGSDGDYLFATGFTIPITGDFAIAGWVKHTTGNFNHNQHDVLIWCGPESFEDDFAVFIRGWSGEWGNIIFGFGASAEVETVGRPFQNNTQETHIAIRRSGGTVSIWVNGVLNNSGTLANTVTLQHCDIGSWDWDYFQGDLWNWAIWTRALSDAQIISLASRASPACFPDSLSLYFPMVTFQEFIHEGQITNDGVDLAAQPRTFLCGE